MARAEQPMSLDPADYEDVDIDDPDNPEWTEEDFANARPAREVLGDAFVDAWAAQREARLATKDAAAAPELSAEVIAFYRGQGPDWQARLNEDLVRIKRRG